jgi:tight adherence protein C
VNATQVPGILDALASPVLFAALIALATGMVWLALAPARPRQDVADRLDDYLERGDLIQELELRAPLAQRTLAPGARRALRFFGGLLPARNVAITEAKLEQAGRPFGMTALDYQGLRLLATVGLFSLLAFLTYSQGQGWTLALRNGLLGALVGLIGSTYWLRLRVNRRKHTIQRALPDALDMMTIGVEAGLAFESAMVRVGDLWHNTLTEELRRAVGEMRVGMSREEALKRMAERCGVDDLSTFVAVLVQSSALGVSIAEVLHTQADQMRLKQRLRAEELARQAGIKMVFPLVFLIFPAMFIVILGPAAVNIAQFFGNTGTGIGGGVP